ncbi:hypothetical protein GCM10009069_11460 [Algimonas arctica]|uniref:DUF5655 domain-containing protein n=1 Tax=Algimonas arctica TaxID=1479486 RepID=A0A8J3CRF5_9PROT|nr:DUF4287 domain-containing protein [Algimonas arctica]GHA90007.1 hypothetical protein GCM10009069_11460 [Algimonas arctica]
MAASPDDQLATMLTNIPEKTGQTLDAWKKIIAKSGHEKHGAIVKLLKSEHGVTHGFANLIATKARESGEDVDLIATQYSGPKSGLKPLHDLIVKYAKSLGQDVELAPKKASHSLRRKKQFALIIPATKSRIDLGLALKGDETTGRLEPYNAMCSHRVRLESSKDFDTEVKGWLKDAYSRSG